MVSEIRARLDAASAESQPIGALSALARTLRDDGMSHDSIRECFDAHRARRESDADLTVYEATLDVMQSIDGWFAEEGAQIREARSSDMNGYRTLFQVNECLRGLGLANGNADWVERGTAYVEHNVRTEFASWEATADRFKAAGSRLWVMVDQGTVIGSVGIVRQPDGECELARMYVDASCRRKGYGRALFETALAHARSLGSRRISLATPSVNAPGMAFYASLGFVPVGSFMAEPAPGFEEKRVEISRLHLELRS
jgi:GNAT superfamily N-acetyltransferase